jgi:hypothetical protein
MGGCLRTDLGLVNHYVNHYFPTESTMIRLGSGVLYSRLAGNIEVSKWHWQTQDRRLFSIPQKVRTEKAF